MLWSELPGPPGHHVMHAPPPPLFEYGDYDSSDDEDDEFMDEMMIDSTFSAVHDKEFSITAPATNVSQHDPEQISPDIFTIMKRSSELYEKWMLAEAACATDPNNVAKAQERRALMVDISKLAQQHSIVPSGPSLPADAASHHSG